MADDISFPVTPGVQIAADEIAGKKFQRVKLTHGADGTALDASSADPLPVTVVGGGGATQAYQTLSIDNGYASGSDNQLLAADSSTTAYVVTGYSFTSWFVAGLSTEEAWQVIIGWSNAGTIIPLANFLLHGNYDRAVFAGSVETPVAVLANNRALHMRLLQWNGSQSSIHLFGHLSYYVH